VAGCNIMNLTMALFSALLAFLVGANQTESSDTCTAISILLHYLFLTTAFWNNVIAYDVWKTFGQGGGAFVFCRNVSAESNWQYAAGVTWTKTCLHRSYVWLHSCYSHMFSKAVLNEFIIVFFPTPALKSIYPMLSLSVCVTPEKPTKRSHKVFLTFSEGCNSINVAKRKA